MNPRPLRAALLFLVFVGACQPQAAQHTERLGELEHLATPAGRGSSAPNLAVAPDGAVYLSWLELRADSSRQLRFASLDGDHWSAPRAIASGSDWLQSPADAPSLLVLSGGRMVAHFLQREHDADRDRSYGVRLIRSSDGGTTWSRPAAPLREGLAAEHGFAALFPAARDSVGVLWLDGRDTVPGHEAPGETALRYAALAPDGWLGPEVVLDGRACDCCAAAVALSTRGPIVAYRDRSRDEIRDIHLARRVDGRWLPGQPVHVDGWRIDGCPANAPAVAADGERAVVAWFTAARGTPRVLAAFSGNAGASFGGPVRVDGGNPTGHVGAVLLDNGDALVSWVERTAPDAAEIQVRLVSPAGRLGNPVLIAESEATGVIGVPRMVRSGRAIIFAWARAGRSPRVWTARIHLGGT